MKKIIISIILIIAGLVIGGYVLFYSIFLAGNFWCEPTSVEKQLVYEHPEVTKVVSINRGVFSDSRVLVTTKDGGSKTFCLDSNILWSYTFEDCSK